MSTAGSMCCGWRRWHRLCPVLVEVRAAGIQPGEVMIRKGSRPGVRPAGLRLVRAERARDPDRVCGLGLGN